MEASWNWHAEDWWNQQLEDKVEHAEGRRKEVTDLNRSSGVIPRTERAQQKPSKPTPEIKPEMPLDPAASPDSLTDLMAEAMKAPKSLRWQTTSHQDQIRMLSHMHNMPSRKAIVDDLAQRKKKNTSTTIDFSGFGDAPTPKDWVSNARIGQRDLVPEKLKELQPTAAEREEQRQRKLKFKFHGQISFGNDAPAYHSSSTLPKFTPDEVKLGQGKLDDSLAKMIKTSKIDFVFNQPGGLQPKDFTSTLRSTAPPVRDVSEIMAERERARLMKAELTKNQYSLKYDNAPPSSSWRTTMRDAITYDPKQAMGARGAEASELKKHLQRHHFEYGREKLVYQTSMQAANNILKEAPRDPKADKERALALKKQLITSRLEIGFQDEYM